MEVADMGFDMIMDRISPKLRAIAKKVCGMYTYCDEDDFFQEASARLWELYNAGDLEGKTDSYILQGCYFFLKNYIRKLRKGVKSRSVSMDAPTAIDGGAAPGESLPDPAGKIGQEIMFLLADDIGSRFTPKEKDVFYYRLEGYTTREIGERIGTSHVMVVKIEVKIRKKCAGLREEILADV